MFLGITHPLHAQPWDGLGTQAEPFLIEDANDMQAIGIHPEHWDKHFLLTNDIDLSAFDGQDGRDPYNIIGYYESELDNQPFTGVFDGGSHTISNFTYVNAATVDNIGLFGYVDDPNAEIKNLGLLDPNIQVTDNDYTGSLISTLKQGSVNACYTNGGSISGNFCVGGLVANNYGTITDCYTISLVSGSTNGEEELPVGAGGIAGCNSGTIMNCHTLSNVTGACYAGGLVGLNKSGEIYNSYATGNITGNVNYFGGLVGYNMGIIDSCYATGNVDGGYNAGGLVGLVYCWDGDAIISNCYATGGVSWGDHIGGLIGEIICVQGKAYISNCSAKGNVSGYSCVGGQVGSVLCGKDDVVISNCYAIGDVSWGDYIGGLIGEIICDQGEAYITSCFAKGDVSGYSFVGGQVGSVVCGEDDVTISNCYATGDVSWGDYIGGLIGDIWSYHSNAYVTNCYAKGRVSGDYYVGGLVGRNYENAGNISFCYWDVQTSGQTTSDGGKGLTTEQMMSGDTYFIWGVCGNEGLWTIDDGNDYPHLAWENAPGEPLPTAQLSDYLTGEGTEADPYLIYDPNQMNRIGLFPCEWDKYYSLMADIDMSGFTGNSYNIIGCAGTKFSGFLNGNNHTISNLTYSGNHNGVGLFGYVESDWQYVIKNLGLLNPQINAGQGNYVGTLAGWFSAAGAIECYVEGGTVSGGSYVGGMLGVNEQFGLYKCYTTCDVYGYDYTGGLVGYNPYGDIGHCYATGSVCGNDYVGGLVGGHKPGSIGGCYASGHITGDDYVGGFIGIHEDSPYTEPMCGCYANGDVSGDNYVGGFVGHNSTYIYHCYASGHVAGNSIVGGFIGYNTAEIITSFWDIQSSDQENGVGSGPGEVYGKTTAEMMQKASLTPWCFVDNSQSCSWRMCEDGVDYPRLWWESVPGDFYCPDRVDMGDFDLISRCWLLDEFYPDHEECEIVFIRLGWYSVIDINDLVIFASNWLSGR
ncbi:MAG: hypothetical protein JW860_10090 [Sedimentisphaerales bacterium]|nr:hypothetical protein [Sedimentisphaerales bacterium]